MPPHSQRAVVITAPGGPEVLVHKPDWPLPRELAADEVLIAVAAAGINRHDCNQRAAGPSREPNPVPGLEVSGKIVACGSHVRADRLGQPVVALTDGGGYAEYVATDASLALPLPDNLDWIAGAALPEAMFTAWFNFFELMRMQAGETALIHGGTSGVGTIAVQLLRELGHNVFATAGTPEKRELAIRLGYRAAFDYADRNLSDYVREATAGKGVDVILDTSGGAHLSGDLQSLARGGRISFLSAGGGKEIPVSLRALMGRQASLTGAFLRSTPLETKRRIAAALLTTVWPLVGERIVPLISRTYPLMQASSAHAFMESNSHMGKLVLELDTRDPGSAYLQK